MVGWLPPLPPAIFENIAQNHCPYKNPASYVIQCGHNFTFIKIYIVFISTQYLASRTRFEHLVWGWLEDQIGIFKNLVIDLRRKNFYKILLNMSKIAVDYEFFLFMNINNSGRRRSFPTLFPLQIMLYLGASDRPMKKLASSPFISLN